NNVGASRSVGLYFDASNNVRLDPSTTNSDLILASTGSKVGIGSAAPTGRLHVADTGTDLLVLQDTGVASVNNFISIQDSSGVVDAYWDTSAIGNYYGSATYPSYAFNGDLGVGIYRPATDNIGFTTQGTERMRIDSTGNVGIGTNNPITHLQVYGSDNTTTGITQNVWNASTATHSYATLSVAANNGGVTGHLLADGLGGSVEMGTPGIYLGAYSNHPIGFGIAQTERMRIATSGNVGIGTTGPSNRLEVRDTQASNAVGLIYNTNTGASAEGVRVRIDATTPGTSNLYANFQKSGGTTIGSISGDGAGGIQYNMASDRRLKGNIRDTHYGIADLMKIRVRDYYYLGHNVDTNGFIAQELYEAYPPAVSKPEDETKQWWQVDYGRLTPLLVKGVQDVYGLCEMSKTQIEDLSRRLASVEQSNARQDQELQSLRNRAEKAEQENRAIKAWICAKDSKAPFCQ
ncbi:MAG: tail fiber domain-containing protein, partial [Bdellovibrionales bacterium]